MSQNILLQLKGDVIHYGLIESFGEMSESAKINQIANVQTLGFSTGRTQVMAGKYYKLGYYISNPGKIFGLLKRKFKK